MTDWRRWMTFRRSGRPESSAEATALVRAGEQLEKRADHAGAEDAYRRADAAGSAEGASNLGVLLFERGDIEAARASLVRADERGSGMGAFRLGFLLQEIGQTAEAERAYRRGVERGNDHAANNLATMLMQRGDYRGARETYRRMALSSDPKSAAQARERLRRIDAAGGGRPRPVPPPDFDPDASPVDALLWIGGDPSDRRVQRARAIVFDRGLDIVSRDPTTAPQIIALWQGLGEPERAERIRQRAADARSGSRTDLAGKPRDGASMGEELYQAGEFDAARAAFAAAIGGYRLALQQRPDDLEVNTQIAGALNNLGLCLSKLGRIDEAAEALQAAATVFEGLCGHDAPDRWRPFLAGTLQSLAGLLADNQRFEQALAVSRRAVELRRTDSGGVELARTLRMFAHVRAAAGTELAEAQAAADEAQALYMTALTATPDPAYVNEIYTTERVQSLILHAQGRHEDASRVEELVRRRHLDALPAMLRAQRAR